jgi:hypothetical protein
MKKILMVALALTCFGISSFAAEEKEMKNTDYTIIIDNTIIDNTITIEDNPDCIAGQTICGSTYSMCRPGGYTVDEQIGINGVYEFFDCELGLFKPE